MYVHRMLHSLYRRLLRGGLILRDRLRGAHRVRKRCVGRSGGGGLWFGAVGELQLSSRVK